MNNDTQPFRPTSPISTTVSLPLALRNAVDQAAYDTNVTRNAIMRAMIQYCITSMWAGELVFDHRSRTLVKAPAQ